MNNIINLQESQIISLYKEGQTLSNLAKKFNITIYKKFRHTSDKTREKRAILFDEMRKYNVKGRLRLQRLNEETPKGEATV